MRFRRSFFWFVGWSVLFALVYYLVSDYYASLVVHLADVFANVAVPVTLQPHPKELVVISPEARQPMGAPYSLYPIGLNVIFAPALVLTTVGPTLGGALRSVAAVLIMLLLHAVKVMSIMLFYVSTPDNTMITL